MSKKISIIVSILLFVLLVVLFYFEMRWPEGGVDFMSRLFH